jgi:hypothetical protein
MQHGPHPQHGLNPTKVECFICRRNTNEVYLYGNDIPGKAPESSPVDFRICAQCKIMSEKNTFWLETEAKEDDEGHYFPIWFGEGVWVPNGETERIMGKGTSSNPIHYLSLKCWEDFRKQNEQLGVDFDFLLGDGEKRLFASMLVGE